MLRRRILTAPILALALILRCAVLRPTCAAPPAILTMPESADAYDSAPPEAGIPEYEQAPAGSMLHPPSRSMVEFDTNPSDCDETATESETFFDNLKWLGLRHSSRSGRNVGVGVPLTGTSWLNRPFYFGGQLGTIWLTRPINSDLSTDTDMFGGIFAGWDWDYYWGTELAINRATPEIINRNVPDAERGDRLMQETISLMYYPWGDALFRPYWRAGIGATEIDWPTDDGYRRDETLWTFPIGIGLKYPFRRYLSGRAEFTDHLALGNSGVSTQHNLTLTFGLEWRFGVHPRSYWPWNPSRHIW